MDHAQRSSLTGEGALLAALGAHRTGRMRDIVATIQAEQDRVIRSDLGGVLVVQGGPGTGKTAVALHRAAYLLYTHRERLGRSGVLLVGPNRRSCATSSRCCPRSARPASCSSTARRALPGRRRAATSRPRSPRSRATSGWPRARRAVRDRSGCPRTAGARRRRRAAHPARRPTWRAARSRARRSRKPHNQAAGRSSCEPAGRARSQLAGGIGSHAHRRRPRRPARGPARLPATSAASSTCAGCRSRPSSCSPTCTPTPARLAAAAPGAGPAPSARCCCATGGAPGPSPTCRCSTRRPSCSARTTSRPRGRRAAAPEPRGARGPRQRAGTRCATSTPRSRRCRPSSWPTGSPRPDRC